MWGGLSDGKFGHAGAFVDRLGTAVPLAPGVFLDRVALGVCVNPPPLKVKGEVGIGFGPDYNGAKAIGLNGWFQYTGGSAWLIEAVPERLDLKIEKVGNFQRLVNLGE